MQFPVLTNESVPSDAKDTLARVAKAYGFVPNLIGVMAGAPALAKAYQVLQGLFEQTSLSPIERQIILLSTSVENGCAYCVAAHTSIARMQRIPNDVINAIRDGNPIQDAKFEALRVFTTEVVRRRGWACEEVTESFAKAGYRSQQALEVILGVGMKTLSNYANHLANTPLDGAFSSAAWESQCAARKV